MRPVQLPTTEDAADYTSSALRALLLGFNLKGGKWSLPEKEAARSRDVTAPPQRASLEAGSGRKPSEAGEARSWRRRSSREARAQEPRPEPGLRSCCTLATEGSHTGGPVPSAPVSRGGAQVVRGRRRCPPPTSGGRAGFWGSRRAGESGRVFPPPLGPAQDCRPARPLPADPAPAPARRACEEKGSGPSKGLQRALRFSAPA